MASWPIIEGNDGANREKQRYSESKVYTRKAFKGRKKQNTNVTTNAPAAAANNDSAIITTTATTTTTTTDVTTIDNNKNENEGVEIGKDENSGVEIDNNENKASENENEYNGTGNNMNENNGTENNRDENDKDKTSIQEQPTQTLTVVDTNSAQQPVVSRLDAASDDSSSLNRQQDDAVATTTGEDPSGNGVVAVKSGENRVKISLGSSTKHEMREIRKKLGSELDTVRSLVKRIEEKEVQISGVVSSSRVLPVSDGVDNGVKRGSEVASVGVPVTRVVVSRPSRPLNQLSISTVENSPRISENVEKEKRTPKANQFYRNSEFLLAKDKIPPPESHKKSKMNGKKHGGNELGHWHGMGSKIFKSCSALLEKLMKHKHGWVFNAPVDVKDLGLHDYFTIIKYPMDLGTVKTRLTKNWYKSPKEFAEDVRLTFHNAMTYNPEGQDVHIMAEQLLKIFEDKWVVIESEYNREMRIVADYEMGFHTPTPRKAPPQLPPLDMRRILDRSESMTHHVDPRLKPNSTTPSGRTPAPKKPKAKDPHKRDMTYDEKQKLSTNLQSLPSEKLDNIVQIIKKRNSSLFQHDDEIEVDIDSVDAETLWELDRFVTNFKKSLSKNKRKAELANQARSEAQKNVQQQTPAPVAAEVPKEIRTDERNASLSSPVQVEKQGDNGSRSSSSSSSSSDSGSSSSDSDSETSSSGSDGGNSPRT